MPFTATRHDGILTLVLDTPGSSVNIFNHATAHQTLELMASVSPADTRAVVIRTAKPTSFVNGVGLMLANASRSREDIARASGIVRQAFASVRRCPVPVIAAVQGTCWGCGVEFLLHTGFRIAADTFDTHFYMTELNDYLFVPVFRSTENLPPAIGLSGAIDMLLWGERWSARLAAERGLINEWAPADSFDTAVDDFTRRVLAGQVQSCLPEHAAARARTMQPADLDAIESARRRIGRLPPLYRKVYNETLDLLIESATGVVAADHADRELSCCADSSLAPEGRAAFGFFYLRQMASTLAIADSKPASSPLRLSFNGARGALREWADELRERRLPPHVVDTADENATERGVSASEVRFTDVGDTGTGSDAGAIVCTFDLRGARPDADLALWKWPGQRFVELSERADGMIGQRVPSLVPYLQRAGYQIARTKASGAFVGPQIVRPWLATQLRFLSSGGSPGALDASLREHGYVRRARDFGAALLTRETLRQLAQEMPGRTDAQIANAVGLLASTPAIDDASDADTTLTAALDVALLGAAVMAIEDTGAHVSFVDLAARELVDYPIRLKSLCSHLTPRNAADALARARARPDLLDPASTERVERWIARGKSFYK